MNQRETAHSRGYPTVGAYLSSLRRLAADRVWPGRTRMADALLCRLVCESGPLTAEEIAARLGADVRSVRRRLARLAEEGVVFEIAEEPPAPRATGGVRDILRVLAYHAGERQVRYAVRAVREARRNRERRQG